jgi:predicted nucleic acid-binding protein
VARVSFDTGVLIGIGRRDTAAWAWLKRAAERGGPPLVCTAAVAECWRDGRRQALLARALDVCDLAPIDLELARAAGEALANVPGAATIDALVAATAARAGALLVTADVGDLVPLAEGHFRGLRVAALRAT